MERPRCEVCNEVAAPILSTFRPESSEYYCKACHKSYVMPKEMYAMEMRLKRGGETVATK